jgi:hypothetical protein
VVLANLGSESETCFGSRVRLVGASISFEKNFYRLPFTPPPSLVRRIGPSEAHVSGESFIWSTRLFTPTLGDIKVLSVTPHIYMGSLHRHGARAEDLTLWCGPRSRSWPHRPGAGLGPSERPLSHLITDSRIRRRRLLLLGMHGTGGDAPACSQA